MTISSFLLGIAGLIQDAGIGVYKSVYASSDIAITVMAVPQTPDNVIVLSPYRVQDSMPLNDSIQGLQIRCRASGENPLVVLERDAALFNLFEGMQNVMIGDVYTALIWRQSQLPGPQDANMRWECSSSYYCRIADPTTHRTD